MKRQSGFTLILLLLVLMSVAGGLLSVALKQTVARVEQEKLEHNREVLLQAKQAVLSYLLDSLIDADPGNIGYLPCPESSWISTGLEGIQNGSCNSRYVNAVGLLPWKSLRIAPLKDSANECLWYVVSGAYKNNPGSELLNPDVVGQLQIEDESGNLYHGADIEDLPVAAIIAPGPALAGQDHTVANAAMQHCRGNYTEANYLEAGALIDYSTDHDSSITDAVWSYLNPSAQARRSEDSYNDQIVWISRKEVWDLVQKQKELEVQSSSVAPISTIEDLTRKIALCYKNFADLHPDGFYELPSAASVGLSDYRDEITYQDVSTRQSGRLSIQVSTSRSNIDAATAGSFTLPSNIMTETCVTWGFMNNEDAEMWNHFKDRFFYSVSSDYMPASGVSFANKCLTSTDCQYLSDQLRNVAAIILYTGDIDDLENEARYSDGQKSNYRNYLASANENAFQASNANSNSTLTGDSEYAYCLYKHAIYGTFVADPCAEMDQP